MNEMCCMRTTIYNVNIVAEVCLSSLMSVGKSLNFSAGFCMLLYSHPPRALNIPVISVHICVVQ